MNPRHEVHIMIKKPGRRERSVLRLRKYSVRERLLRWLFGDAREILVLKPGETEGIITEREDRHAVRIFLIGAKQLTGDLF